MSLSHIDTYTSNGEIALLIGQKNYYGGGEVTEILAGEIKNFGRICVLYHILNFCLHTQYKALHKSVEQVYGAGGLRDVSFMQLLQMFWSTQEELGEDFKETWVRVNPTYPMPFMSYTINEEN